MTTELQRIINLGGRPRFDVDLEIVLRSNMLVQAASGGGKSYLLRRAIEQTAAEARIPQIVIDPEGEFGTLREKFDFVLVGKGGDTPADVRSAPLLARKLLELGASAVVDLFEMPKLRRPEWVAAFIGALIDAPKDLWKDLLVYVDEAHEFAPETGKGQRDSAAETASRHALIDLAAKGRKRGFGVVAATQRIGKLSKDFGAELKNVLVGQTFLDIDRERAAGMLGIAKENKVAFFRDAKTLPPGTFYALGRALALEPTLMKVGPVLTEHPEAGRRQAALPPPTAQIRHLLPQLADLPKEAEAKLKTEADLRAHIVDLERQLVAARRAPPPAGKTTTVTRTVEVVPRDVVAAARAALASNQKAIERLEATVKTLAAIVDRPPLAGAQAEPRTALPAVTRDAADPPAARAGGDEAAARGGQLRMLRALAGTLKDGLSRRELGALAGVKANGGTFGTYLSRLRQAGHVEDGGAGIRITAAGRAAAGNVPQLTGTELLDFWLPQLGEKPAKMLRTLFQSTRPMSREDLAEAVELTGNAGTFGTYLSRLMSRGLVEKAGRSEYQCAEVFRQ